ncbi:PREDICTED: retinol dehydrogenase 11-like [Polistes dominula]|uniref:Retinol dehydrogenase 11-like n=1 Tax=Polistes dominula TaxID=743375 RepID=A0ABM1HU23_POLDO|nr:PREDICTED: retinol dehydrogenase 11-like [Polistes dominula]
MISSWYYVAASVVLFIVYYRKCRECVWGRCKNTSSLQDRVFIVTGANSGIGKETAKELAKRKATVVMACRNMQNAKNVISEIRHQISNGELIPMELDLASFSSIREFAAEILKNFPKIHVLINNAGVYRPLRDRAFTEDGFEIHFGVNYLGHFLLTNLLIERLKESAPSRVVIVTSKLLESGVVDFSNLNGEKCLTIKTRMNPFYSNSKLENMYFGIELAQRMKEHNVNVYMVCPGFAYTGLFRHVKRSLYHYILFMPMALLFLRTANQAAQTVLHCAIEPSLANESGHLYRNCELYEPNKQFSSDIAHELWEKSVELTASKETAK